MKRACGALILGIAMAVLMIAPAVAQQRYGWSISRSATHSCVYSGSLPTGIATLYLWYTHNSPDGLWATDMSVLRDPPESVNILAFTPANGFLNAGDATDLLLAVHDCPDGPLLVGNWTVQIIDPVFNLCLGGLNSSVNCDVNPLLFPNDHLGYANNSVLGCCSGFSLPLCTECGSLAVDADEWAESDSWGRIKSQYR